MNEQELIKLMMEKRPQERTGTEIDMQKHVVEGQPHPTYKFANVPDSPGRTPSFPTPVPTPAPEYEERAMRQQGGGAISQQEAEAFKNTGNIQEEIEMGALEAVNSAKRIMSVRELGEFNKAIKENPNADPLDISMDIIKRGLPDFIDAEPLILDIK